MFLVFHSGAINYGAFILGIVSAIIFYLTENVIYSIVMHFSGNLIGAIAILLSLGTSQTMNEVVSSEEVMSRSDMIISIIINEFFGVFF